MDYYPREQRQVDKTRRDSEDSEECEESSFGDNNGKCDDGPTTPEITQAPIYSDYGEGNYYLIKSQSKSELLEFQCYSKSLKLYISLNNCLIFLCVCFRSR